MTYFFMDSGKVIQYTQNESIVIQYNILNSFTMKKEEAIFKILVIDFTKQRVFQKRQYIDLLDWIKDSGIIPKYYFNYYLDFLPEEFRKGEQKLIYEGNDDHIWICFLQKKEPMDLMQYMCHHQGQ